MGPNRTPLVAVVESLGLAHQPTAAMAHHQMPGSSLYRTRRAYSS